MARTQSEVSRLRRKRDSGEGLTDNEQKVLAEYFSQYAPQKQSLYVTKERKKEWRRLADEQGLSFSSWVQERVTEALSGPGPIVDELREENQRLRDEVAGLQRSSGKLAIENSNLEARIASMEESLMDAMNQALIRLEVDP